MCGTWWGAAAVVGRAAAGQGWAAGLEMALLCRAAVAEVAPGT